MGSSRTPTFILRLHTAQVSSLSFSQDGQTLYTGDTQGHVAAWDLRTCRPTLFWRAHQAGILTVTELGDGLLTHGRDNKMHFFELPTAPTLVSRAPASISPESEHVGLGQPAWSLDVNALAYCRLSILRLGDGDALVANTSLTKDEFVDVYHVPSGKRVHRSVGQGALPINTKTGAVMNTVLFQAPDDRRLSLVVAFEDGRVAHLVYTGTKAFEPVWREEGEDWELVWDRKGHREAATDVVVDHARRFAWSIGIDHHLCRYRLYPQQGEEVMHQLETPYPGRSALAIRQDDRLLAAAGWDGFARLYSAKNGAPLAALDFHRDGLFAIAFAPLKLDLGGGGGARDEDDSSDDEDDMIAGGKALLATGGKEGKISLWNPYPPS